MLLTDKQRRFVDEYLVDLNATQAAIRAGYSQKTAASIGEENLRKPDIAKAVQDAQVARAKRTEITQDMMVRELAKIGSGSR
jgi:phage terminase small subunit